MEHVGTSWYDLFVPLMAEINHTGKALYQTVADSLLEQIKAGELQPNERIPSESKLGSIFGVGRNTVRHAISDLVNQGVLAYRAGGRHLRRRCALHQDR